MIFHRCLPIGIVVALAVAAFCLFWRGGHRNAVPAALRRNARMVRSSAHVDAGTDDRRIVAARTDGSPQAASDQDQAMTRLMDRGDLSSGYGELMRRLHADAGHDETTRNFAIQHLGHYARERHRRGAYSPRSREAEEIRATLWSAARETSTTVAAPAFRALADLALFDPEVGADEFDRKLVDCLSDPQTALPVRVMAAQLCGERRIDAAHSALVRIGGDASTPTPLALAASRAARLVSRPH